MLICFITLGQNGKLNRAGRGAGPLGLKDLHVLTICCRLLPRFKMIWRDVRVCVNRREHYEMSMSTLTWYNLFKCKSFEKGSYISVLDYISVHLMIYHRTFYPLCEILNMEMCGRPESSLHRQERLPGSQTCTQKMA